MDVPKNWPRNVTYLTAPALSSELSAGHLAALRTRPHDLPAVPAIPAIPTQRPGCHDHHHQHHQHRHNPLVKILPIHDPSHPAHGQLGLFAARRLPPGSLVTLYLGRVHPGGGSEGLESSSSDYDLWLDRDAGIAVDGAAEGNEGRFVNDYRGVPDAGKRPNAEFRELWSDRLGMRSMAVFVLPESGDGQRARGRKEGKKKSGGGIEKGEEILVSYGKGFWEARAATAPAAATTELGRAGPDRRQDGGEETGSGKTDEGKVDEETQTRKGSRGKVGGERLKREGGRGKVERGKVNE